MSTLHQAALDLAAAGCSVIPVAADGSKRPLIAWKQYQTTPADRRAIDVWYGPQSSIQGLGVITGAVSGNLELLEVEGRAIDLVPQLAQLLTDSELGDLWQRLCAGWLVQSPSGGLHFLYRVTGGAIAGNTKLARRPNPDNDQLVDVLIETRGEGGYLVTAPSAGTVHPTGKPWVLIAGGPTTCPVLTIEERDALHIAASTFDAMPVREPILAPEHRATFDAGADGLRPGDDYNARASWDDLLTPHGWQRVKRLGSGYGWVRPDKDARDGISATTGTAADGVDRLYVFSSSTEFETETPYSKFAAYALLEHHGDMAAAASALRRQGYGSARPEPTLQLVGPPLERPAERPTQPGAASYAVAGQQHDAHAFDGATVRQLHPQPATSHLAHTDDANALLLIERHGHQLRHCSDRGRWYAWDGHVWAECPRSAGQAREYAKDVARALPEAEKKDVDHKKRTLSAIGISAMLTQAASDPRVSVSYNQLDAHPWELNTPGGIVNLRTGELMPADPAKLHTRTTLCTPDPNADRTVWLQFLHTTFGGDQALIDYLQRLVGYSAIGVVGPHVLPFCHGSGGNGKGVFLEACVKVLADYATTAPAGFLIKQQHTAHETEIARLAGARMVLCSEVEEDDRFDEAKVKRLTGGDTLTARFMQMDHFTFTPSHQLWAMGNDLPNVRSGGRSFWRRLRKVPFLHEVAEADIVDDLQGIFATEHGPAVLSWIVDGAVAYAARGLEEPEAVKAATGEYAHDQDTVGRFLEEGCQVGGGSHVTTKVALVRTAYEKWCRDAGEEPVSAKALTVALKRHGIESKHTRTARMYEGLALLGDEENLSRDGARADQGWSL